MTSTMRRTDASKAAKWKTALASCLGVLLIGALLQGAGWLKGDALVFPGVGEILRAFVRLLFTGHTWALIGGTLWRLLLSMAVSVLIGLLLGLAEGLSGFFRSLLRPLMTLLRSIPMIVLIVILMVLMPYPRIPARVAGGSNRN